MAQEQDFQRLLDAFEKYNDTLKSAVGGGGKNQSSAGGTETPASKSFDKSTAKIVAALGVLNSSVLATNKSEADKKEKLKDFNKEVDDAVKSLKELEDAANENAKAAADAAEKSKLLAAAKLEETRLGRLSSSERKKEEKERLAAEKAEEKKKKSEATANAMEEYSRSKRQAEQMASGTAIMTNLFGNTQTAAMSADALSKVFDAVVKSVSDYTKAIYAGERGLAVAARATNTLMEGLFDAASVVLAFMGPVGLVTAGLLQLGNWLFKKFNKGAEEAAKQLDMLYKGFNDLSKAGASTIGGLEGVRDTAHKLGYSMKELDGFVGLISKNTPNLKLFGATVGDGTKQFAKVAHELWHGDFGKALQAQGIQLEEQRESAMAYMTIMARSGQITKMNDQLLVKGTAEFVKELDLAAQLTGATRKEQEEARLNAQADEQFRAAQRVAERENDQEKIKYLKTMEIAAGMVSKYDKTGASGILRFAAGGYGAGDDAVKAAFTYGADKLEGGMGAEKVARTLSSGIGEGQETFDVTTMYGKKPPVLGETVGSANLKQALDASAKLGIPLEEYLKTQQPTPSGAITKQNEVDRSQRETAINLDKAVGTFSGATDKYASATKLLEKGSNYLVAAAKSINGAIDGLSKRIFGSTSAPGPGPAPSPTPKTTPAPSPAPATGATAPVKAAPPSTQGPSSPSSGSSSTSSAPNALSELFRFATSGSGKEENFKRLDPSFRDKIVAVATEYKELTGNPLTINSAHRSEEENKRVGGAEKSKHKVGRAVDIQEYNDDRLIEIMRKNGITNGYGDGRRVSHFTARNGGIFKGPTTGYNVELHGEEAVVPLNGSKNVTKQALPVGMGDDNRTGEEMVSLLRMLIGQNETVISLLDSNNDYSKKLVSVMS